MVEESLYKTDIIFILVGIFRVPWELCAPIYVNGIAKFGSKQRRFLQEVHLVDLADDILDLSCTFYQEWNKNKKLDIKQLLQNFARKNPQYMSRAAVQQKTDRDPLSEENSSPKACEYLENSKGKLKFMIVGKVQVFIYRDNLVKAEGIDVLVSPENNAFTGSGALAQSILKAAGWQYQQQHQSIQQKVYHSGKALMRGEIRIISAGDLKYKYVLNVVVNRLSNNRPPGKTELHEFKCMLKHVLENLDALALCNMKQSHDNFRLSSIAMPLLGAGNYE